MPDPRQFDYLDPYLNIVTKAYVDPTNSDTWADVYSAANSSSRTSAGFASNQAESNDRASRTVTGARRVLFKQNATDSLVNSPNSDLIATVVRPSDHDIRAQRQRNLSNIAR